MSADTITEQIAALVRRAERTAYERGKADAKRELLAFLGARDSDVGAMPLERQHLSTSEPTTEQQVRKRAPKGTVPRFIKRVLSSHPGQTPQQIMSYAETDDERLIAPASIRSELNVGRSKGKYVDIDGQWNLAGDGGSDEAEDQSMEVQTSASSDHDHNGGRSNAAALVSDPDR